MKNSQLSIRRKLKLIQVPPLLFRPSKLDTVILEEILNETEPTCFVDGYMPAVKGLRNFTMNKLLLAQSLVEMAKRVSTTSQLDDSR